MFRAAVFVVMATLVAGPARAQQVTEIFKCKGADGHWTYTNDRREAERQKCEVVTRQVNVAPASKAPASRSARPGEFPKETAAERASGRERQREILEKELVTDESNRADFSLSNSNSKTFPPGDYKIDIYLDDELIQTVRYKVQ